MQVTYFHRKRRPNANYSIELVFEELRRQLASQVESRVRVAPFYSNGILRRLAIMIDARCHQGQINHVTGDINFAALMLDPSRTVLTSHDCSFLMRTRGMRRWLLKLLWVDLPVRRARFVTTVSEAAKQDLLSHTNCNPEKIVVIHNPISADFVRTQKTFNTAHPRILQVGTAINKNIARIAEAICGLACTFVIIGRLDDEQQEHINRLGIQYENHTNLSASEVVRQYELADVVMFASTVEGFGLPIVEANAIGRPVITSNISSMPEVAGDAACLVDPFSVESIRTGLLRVLSDEAYRSDLITKGFSNAARYQADEIARKYLLIYQKISGGPTH